MVPNADNDQFNVQNELNILNIFPRTIFNYTKQEKKICFLHFLLELFEVGDEAEIKMQAKHGKKLCFH